MLYRGFKGLQFMFWYLGTFFLDHDQYAQTSEKSAWFCKLAYDYVFILFHQQAGGYSIGREFAGKNSSIFSRRISILIIFKKVPLRFLLFLQFIFLHYYFPLKPTGINAICRNRLYGKLKIIKNIYLNTWTIVKLFINCDSKSKTMYCGSGQ